MDSNIIAALNITGIILLVAGAFIVSTSTGFTPEPNNTYNLITGVLRMFG